MEQLRQQVKDLDKRVTALELNQKDSPLELLGFVKTFLEDMHSQHTKITISQSKYLHREISELLNRTDKEANK